MSKSNIFKKISGCGVLSGLGVVVSFINIPLLPMVPFLKYDASDVLVLIANEKYGFKPALLVGMIISVLISVTTGADAGLYGLLMHLANSWILLVGFKIFKDKFWLIGMINILVMLILNLIVTPYYYNMSVQAVMMMLPWIALFNFIKFILNYVIFKFLSSKLKK